MGLLNGVSGIGTGWSTSIPRYNPRDLVSCMRQLIESGGTECEPITPWVNRWEGKLISNATRTKYAMEGLIEKVDDSNLLISELPVGRWTSDYKEKVLDKMIETRKIKD